MNMPLQGTALVWSGRLPDHHMRWAEASSGLSTSREDIQVRGLAVSPYRTRFLQGAFLAPRILFFVQRTDAGPLGAGAGRVRVVSERSGLERNPWKALSSRSGGVEAEFVMPVIQGEHVVPFRLRSHPSVVIPWYGKRVLSETDEELDRFPGLAEWWRESCALWVEHREETSTASLAERADYKSGLTGQFPIARQRVVYAASGSRLTGTRVLDPRVVVEKSAYWISVSHEQEAHYLVGLLNSSTLDDAVKPYQPVGIGGARHFDKNIFEVAIPQYDGTDPDHIALASAAARAEVHVGEASLPASAQRARRLVRDSLDVDGLADELGVLASRVLGL